MTVKQADGTFVRLRYPQRGDDADIRALLQRPINRRATVRMHGYKTDPDGTLWFICPFCTGSLSSTGLAVPSAATARKTVRRLATTRTGSCQPPDSRRPPARTTGRGAARDAARRHALGLAPACPHTTGDHPGRPPGTTTTHPKQHPERRPDHRDGALRVPWTSNDTTRPVPEAPSAPRGPTSQHFCVSRRSTTA